MASIAELTEEQLTERFEALSEKLAVPVDTLRKEYKKKLTLYGVQAAALKALKGSYQASMKSDVPMITGVIFGISGVQNANSFIWKEVQADLDVYRGKYGYGWAAEAYKNGLIDSDGKSIGTKDVVESLKRTNPDTWEGVAHEIGLYDEKTGELLRIHDVLEVYKATYGDGWIKYAVAAGASDEKGEPLYTEKSAKGAKFLIGKPVLENVPQRKAFGLFTIAGVTKPGIIFIKHGVEDWYPDFTKEYMFKASCTNLTAPVYSIRSTKVFAPNETGKVVEYDQMYHDLEQRMLDNCLMFEDVYDDETKTLTLSTKVNPKVILSRVIIAEVKPENPEFDAAYVEIIPLSNYEDNVVMRVDKKMIPQLMDDASGVLAFNPYYKKDKTPSGEIFGFIPDEQFRSIIPNDPSETEAEDDDSMIGSYDEMGDYS